MAVRAILASALAVVLIAAAYQYLQEQRNAAPASSARSTADLEQTLKAFKSGLEQYHKRAPPCSKGKSVLMGFNACVDLIVQAGPFFRQLRQLGAVSDQDFTAKGSYPTVNKHEELSQLFSFYFSRGIAVEKFCTNTTLFSELIDATKSIQSQMSLGGNSAIMSTRFAHAGCRVQIASNAIGPSTAARFPKSVELPRGGDGQDDIHLIVEYPRGPLFETEPTSASGPPLSSPRANRFILTKEEDISIPVDMFKARVSTEEMEQVGAVVLSGFHLLDGKPSAARNKALDEMAKWLQTLPSHIITHLEIASMGEAGYYKELAMTVLKHSKSLGANEQEVAALYDALTEGRLAEGYANTPDIGSMMRKINYIMDITGVARVHLHNIAFQAICQREGVFDSNPMYSLMEAQMISTKQACMLDDMTDPRSDELDLIFPGTFKTDDQLEDSLSFDPKNPVTCWKKDGLRGKRKCCVIPVLVCKRPQRVVGLGDHISSSGLTTYL